MRVPSAQDIVRVWELGQEQPAWYLGWLMLAAAFPKKTQRELTALTIGQRDTYLFRMREQILGPQLLASGRLFVGTPFQGVTETGWPQFFPQPGQIDLDQIKTGIAPGGWMVLHQGGAAAGSINSACRVRGVSTGLRSGFAKRGSVTHLDVSPLAGNQQFDLRRTIAFVQSEEVSRYEEQIPATDPPSGSTLNIAGRVPNLNGERTIAVSGQRSGVGLRADLGGVFQLRGDEASRQGLVNYDVLTLAIDSEARIYAGTSGDVFLRVENEWTSLHLPVSGARSMAIGSDLSLFVGTGEGVFQFSAGTWKSLMFPGGKVISLTADAHGKLFASSSRAGVLEFAAGKWLPISEGLQLGAMRAMTVGADGSLWLGADGGVFKYSNDTWSPTAKLSSPVLSIAAGTDGVMHAGTADGVFRLEALGWVRQGLKGRGIVSLGVASVGDIIAATRDGGVYFQLPPDKEWHPVDLGISGEISSLAVAADGDVFAAAGNTAVALSDDGRTEISLARKMRGTIDGALAGTLDAAVISAPLTKRLNELDITLAKDALLTVTTRGSSWLIVTRDDPQSSPWGKFTISRESGALNLYENLLLEAIAMPTEAANPLSLQRWSLRDQAGRQFTLRAHPGELAWEQAPAWGEEAALLSRVVEVNGGSTLVLKDPVEIAFDPSTALVHGNVAPAGHGETVRNEVLGSGRHSQPNQTFTLKKPPLTYIRGGGTGSIQSTLEVRVTPGHTVSRGRAMISQGSSDLWEPWKEVQTLANSGPRDRHYVVRIDDDGVARLVFGDGVYGSRLPTGVENIMATYRSGTGTAGNIGAERLTILRRAPMGVRSVTNPLPAGGGADPDTIDEARGKIPLSTRTFDRIVSMTDYEDFARTFAGIGKARTSVVWNGKSRVLHLTVMAIGGAVIAAGDPLYDQLVAAIDDLRALPHPVVVQSYEPIHFDLEAALTLDPDADRDEVALAAEQAIEQGLATDNRALGQNVTASELTAIIQAVPGVQAVDITALYQHNLRRQLHQTLRARPAHWNAQRKAIEPAQLLILNSIALS